MTRQSPTRIRQRAGSPSSFLTPGGRGSFARAAIFVSVRVAMRSGNRSSSFAAEGLMMTRYSATRESFAPSSEAPPHDFEGNALLVRSRVGDEMIVDVFPQVAISIGREIDLHGDFTALLVGQKTDAFHTS